MNKFSLRFGAVAMLSIPLAACAATTTFKTLVTAVTELLNTVINALIMLSAFIMIWGVFRYLVASGDKERITKARDVIVYGLLGIVIMYSFLGLVTVAVGTFTFDNAKPSVPQFTN